MYKNVKTDPNQSLFYSAAPQYGQRIRVTRMQRQQVRVNIKVMPMVIIAIIERVIMLLIFLVLMIGMIQIMIDDNLMETLVICTRLRRGCRPP